MKTRDEMICDVLEALESVKKYKKLYQAVLKKTGSKKDALDVVKYVANMDKERGDYETQNVFMR